MSLPRIEPLPDENDSMPPESLPPARRRRQRRMVLPAGQGKRAEFLHDLALRTVPSFDFFLFSLLAGLVLSIGLLMDSAALVFLAALLAPFMAPAVGVSLGTITGSFRFLSQSLGSLGIGSLIVFLTGTLGGWIVNLLPARVYQQAAFHAYFTWPDFIVLLLGAGLTTYLLVRSPNTKPLITSAAIVYELYLPAGAAGFGLVSGINGLWAAGLGLFFLHLLWAVLAGVIVLTVMVLRPNGVGAYLLSIIFGTAAFAALAAVLVYNPLAPQPPVVASAQITPISATVVQGVGALPATPTLTPTAIPAATLPPTASPVPATPTPTRTLVPTRTPTVTITPDPTPVWARINASEGNGALVRGEPNYDAAVVQSLLNETLVEVIGEVTSNNNVAWVHIRMVNGKEGWIVRTLLRTATPAPNW